MTISIFFWSSNTLCFHTADACLHLGRSQGLYTAQVQNQNTKNNSFLLSKNKPWFSKCGPWTRSVIITWALVRNAECRGSPQIVYFNQIPWWLVCTLNLRSSALRHTQGSSCSRASDGVCLGESLALTSLEKGGSCGGHNMSSCWAPICFCYSALISSECPLSDNPPCENRSSRRSSSIMETLSICPPSIPRENSPLLPLFPH